MIKRIYALMLIPLLAASCSKSEPSYDLKYSDTAISFASEELSADWESKTTRGTAVEDINTVPSIMVYSFLTTPNENTTGPLIDNKEAKKGAGNLWGFNPEYFYPVTETLDFLAYAPQSHHQLDAENNGITQSFDFDTKTVNFTYDVPSNGRNHPDLMLSTPVVGCSSTNPVGTLQFNHVLTKLIMSARMVDGTDAEFLSRYKISQFTLRNIKVSGNLDYNTTSIGEWSDGSYGDFIVKQMLPGEDPAFPAENPTLLTIGDYKSVMNNGQSLFMIPQPIEQSTNANGKPTIQITVADTKPTVITDDGGQTEDVYLTFQTDRLDLPSFDGKGWLQGQSVDIQFEFAMDPDKVVIPMSVTCKLIPWVNQEVDTEVDANIFAWLDTRTIKANQATTLKLYTNGEVTSISAGNTLGAKVNDEYYPVGIPAVPAGQYSFEVEIDNSHDGIITKKFYINVE